MVSSTRFTVCRVPVLYTDTTKTEQSKRPLSIPAELADLLRRYRVEQGERRLKVGDRWSPEWVEHPRLFTQWGGKPMHPNAPYQELQKLLQRNGLPTVSLHSLRHTTASLLINSDVPPKLIAEQLGHASASITQDIYSHIFASSRARAAQAIEIALAPKTE